MNNHPYPEHIRDKVALGLFAADCEDNPELDPNEEPHPGYYEYADTALQALWDASRVEEREDGQLSAHDFSPGTLIETHHGELLVVTERHLWEPVADGREVLKPYSHIIYWGDTDE